MTERSSSVGERGAIVGYAAQYRIAAEIIHRSIVSGQLEWIRLADPEAGKVDDLVIATPGRIDAYQMKWGETTDTVSFRDLAGASKLEDVVEGSGLLGELANGWRLLRKNYPNHRVVIHLISRNFPAPSAEIPHHPGTPSKPNLHGFLIDCWSNDNASTPPSSYPDEWKPALDSLQRACRIESQEWRKFTKDCELYLGYQIGNGQEIPSREKNRWIDDVTELAAFLFRTIGQDKRVIRLDRENLLAGLGWEERFKPLFLHEFPVDRLYQPITATLNELSVALTGFIQGYLALLGTPGSGKSTTLTTTLRYRQGCRVVRYYAFVPDTPGQLRGEASSFLHDIVIELQRRGFSGGRGSQPRTREEFLERFSVQLSELHEQWRKDRSVTFIVVDGLDHIEREQNPIRSLLKDLPLPNTLPKGVVLVLGSQTLELKDLPASIRAQLRESGRELHMQPLSRQAVLTMIDAAKFSVALRPEQKELVWQLSAGHPLATNYLLQMVSDCRTFEEAETLLAQVNPYQNHIDQIYQVYWERIERNLKLKDLLV